MATIPWTASARLIAPGDAPTQVGTLRGCLRAWRALPPEKRDRVQLISDVPIYLDSWASPKALLADGDLSELAAWLDR